MRYKEYNQVEISHIYNNGQRIRNKIVKYNELPKYFGMKEIHTSVGRFKNLIEYFRENNGSIAGIDNTNIEIFYDYIIIDYDSFEINPLLNFLKSLEDIYSIPLINVGIFFSGNKGFHIYIPTEFIPIEPSADLNLRVAELVKMLTKDFFEPDLNIYRKASTIRLPYTLNTKSNLYKIPIYINELSNGIDYIKELAKNVRYEKTFLRPESSSFELSQLYSSVKVNKFNNKPKDIKINGNLPVRKNNKKCIINMLKGGKKDERGGRKNIAFRLAVHFANQELPVDITQAILLKWNEKNSLPLPYSVINNVIKSAYTHNYDFGCNDPVKSANCDSSCFLFEKVKNKIK